MTIATNMAGRGTDILLGGNPAGLASELLHKRGLNPAEVDKDTYDARSPRRRSSPTRTTSASSRRAACTSSARSATKAGASTTSSAAAPAPGRPGSSRFYLSLDDDLMKRFASER